MGRTLPSATQLFIEQERLFNRFKHAVSRSDQHHITTLFDNAHKHVACMAYAAHPIPLQMILLAMLVEEHKEVTRLRSQVAELAANPPAARLRKWLRGATYTVKGRAGPALVNAAH
jgi:hypothetical protein